MLVLFAKWWSCVANSNFSFDVALIDFVCICAPTICFKEIFLQKTIISFVLANKWCQRCHWFSLWASDCLYFFKYSVVVMSGIMSFRFSLKVSKRDLLSTFWTLLIWLWLLVSLNDAHSNSDIKLSWFYGLVYQKILFSLEKLKFNLKSK